MNKLLMAGVAAVLAFVTQPLLADDTADPIVATVNGTALHRSDVIASARGLPEQYQQQIDLIFPALVERLVGLELLAQAGRDAKLADDPEVQKMMKAYENEAIRHVYMTNLIHDGVTDAEVQKRYDAYVASNPPKTEKFMPVISSSRPRRRPRRSSPSSTRARISPSWRRRNPPIRRLPMAAIWAISCPRRW